MQSEPAPPKSIGRTSSFDHPTHELRMVHGYAAYHLERAHESLCRNRLLAGEFTLYLRDKEFQTYGIRHRFENPTGDFYDLAGALQKLLPQIPSGRIWRSAGAMLTRLTPVTGKQLDLFEDPLKSVRSDQLNEAKLKLNERFGRILVRSGATLFINEKCASKKRLGFLIQ